MRGKKLFLDDVQIFVADPSRFEVQISGTGDVDIWLINGELPPGKTFRLQLTDQEVFEDLDKILLTCFLELPDNMTGGAETGRPFRPGDGAFVIAERRKETGLVAKRIRLSIAGHEKEVGFHFKYGPDDLVEAFRYVEALVGLDKVKY